MTIKTNYFDGDISYTSLDAIAPSAALLTNGIYNISGGGLLVSSTSPSSLSVNVATGNANVNGYFVNSDSVTNVSIAANTSGYNRIDSVVLNVDVANKATTIIAVQGIPSSSPVAPTLTSNQLILANITVGNNASVLDSNVITDKRVDTGLFSNNLQSLTTNGYKKIGGGLILQWGMFAATSSTTGTVTFPTQFPSLCLGIHPNISPSGYNAMSVRTSYPPSSNTTFTWESFSASGSATAPGYIMWFALGK